eukprot:3900983-Karenia_brevis.AAC.1
MTSDEHSQEATLSPLPCAQDFVMLTEEDQKGILEEWMLNHIGKDMSHSHAHDLISSCLQSYGQDIIQLFLTLEQNQEKLPELLKFKEERVQAHVHQPSIGSYVEFEHSDDGKSFFGKVVEVCSEGPHQFIKAKLKLD